MIAARSLFAALSPCTTLTTLPAAAQPAATTQHPDAVRFVDDRLEAVTAHDRLRRDGTRPYVPPYEFASIAAAAGCASSVEDLARFAAWQFRLHREAGRGLRALQAVHAPLPG